jgi:hypothetical protein
VTNDIENQSESAAEIDDSDEAEYENPPAKKPSFLDEIRSFNTEKQPYAASKKTSEIDR